MIFDSTENPRRKTTQARRSILRAIPPRRTPAKHVLRAHAPFSKGKRPATSRAPFYHDDFQSSRAIPPRRTPVKQVLRAHAPFSKGKRPRTPRAPFLPRRFPGLTAQFHQGAHPLLRVLRAHAPFSKGKRSVTSRAPVPKYDKIQ